MAVTPFSTISVHLKSMARIKPQALLQQSKKKKGPTRVGIVAIILYVSILAVLAFFLYSSYRYWSRRSKFQTESDIAVSETDNGLEDSKDSNLLKNAVLITSKGSITVELYKDSAPKVVDEFIELCKNGYFKGKLFHCVIKHYVLQAGDNQAIGETEDWMLRGKHYNQLHTSLKHEAFMLGTSKGKLEGEPFKLFITTAPIPDLNEKLVVFGRVIKGVDVVQEIEEVDTDEHYQPKLPVTILDVTCNQKA